MVLMAESFLAILCVVAVVDVSRVRCRLQLTGLMLALAADRSVLALAADRSHVGACGQPI